jgi:hypothetical protein
MVRWWKNEQDENANCVIGIGNVTRVVDSKIDPDLHEAMRSAWTGDWSDRKIVVFRVIPLLAKDSLTYSELCDLFGYKRLKNGSVRVKLD